VVGEERSAAHQWGADTDATRTPRRGASGRRAHCRIESTARGRRSILASVSEEEVLPLLQSVSTKASLTRNEQVVALTEERLGGGSNPGGPASVREGRRRRAAGGWGWRVCHLLAPPAARAATRPIDLVGREPIPRSRGFPNQQPKLAA
jgi:hypothetical protein